MKKQYEAFEEALALIERPGGWAQGSFAKPRDGSSSSVPLGSDQFYAVDRNAFCAVGAVVAVCRGDEPLATGCRQALDMLARHRFGVSTESLNDGGRAELAFQRICDLFRAAIRSAKAEAAGQAWLPIEQLLYAVPAAPDPVAPVPVGRAG